MTRRLGYQTANGSYRIGDSLAMMDDSIQRAHKGKVSLILTSPPFPLNKKKRYGNEKGDEFLKWFERLGSRFSTLLTKKGSVVVEMGNSWEPKRPVQSTLHLKALLSLISETTGLRLIQEFVCYNPSRLPSPAEWVNRHRIRVVDSYTHVWWLSKTDFPKANNSRVLRPYSDSMKQLLKSQTYNAGMRPSQHKISKSGFLKNRGGSIAHNFFELDSMVDGSEPRLPHSALRFSNTNSSDSYMRACRESGIIPHPARMNPRLAAFFIEFLTNKRDLVYDPFGGSNTTGFCAEALGRRWLSTEISPDYLEQARLRFTCEGIKISNRVGTL